MRSLAIAIPLTFAALTGACGKNAQEESGAGQSAGGSASEAPSEAQAFYTKRCVECHGATGGGDGRSADSFTPKLANYNDPAWQASITDDQIKQIILKGGVRLGKSPAMPSNPRLKERPEVLDGLVKIIRGFGKLPMRISTPAHPPGHHSDPQADPPASPQADPPASPQR
jgi:mono/diheme cytochrome c family protein